MHALFFCPPAKPWRTGGALANNNPQQGAPDQGTAAPSPRSAIRPKSKSYLAEHIKPDTTIENLDIYVLLKAAGQVETALGLAAHTLFEPRAELSQG